MAEREGEGSSRKRLCGTVNENWRGQCDMLRCDDGAVGCVGVRLL